MEEFITKFSNLVFEYPVWPFVLYVNFTSLIYHFSPIAKYEWVKNNRAMVVFLTASFSAMALGIRDLMSHDFNFSDDDLLYQARLMSSWALSVLIYHIGGFRFGVKKIKQGMKQ